VFPEYKDLRKSCLDKAKSDDLTKANKLYQSNPSLDGPYGDCLSEYRASKGATYSTEIHNLIKKWNNK